MLIKNTVLFHIQAIYLKLKANLELIKYLGFWKIRKVGVKFVIEKTFGMRALLKTKIELKFCSRNVLKNCHFGLLIFNKTILLYTW